MTQGSHGLAAALYGRTRELHLQAERTGFVREMLRGRAGRDGYVLYLRNLLPAYRALEQGLERHRSTPGLGPFAEPALYRSQALSPISLDWPAPAGMRRCRSCAKAIATRNASRRRPTALGPG